ncbi:unnamed protein product [Rotaria magnacalcarata]|uniref:long-chain-fatty-acid--CoA ligase n=11 Tax=Rotaria magnacalcarata TaxID=392030 RepID=A0A816QV36_9BILA|nr:unnamed protein product [Rotaria magnacalcarata]CAF2133751.1 unnamed protein product [Rotaria magnacalcarata]CAF4095028.1 unnamed protein product [Rotaria magnacalcarata]CAF4397269.1 unnamed protein product [Rotaria magnacalcarata]
MDYFFSLLHILFKKPIRPAGAVEIDPIEHIYVHPECTKGLKDYSSNCATTAYESFLSGLRLSGDRPQFSYRQSSDEPFKSYTYKQVFEIIKEIGSGVVSIGFKPSSETFIGIYSSTSVNYALCLYSAWPYSMVPIGIYDSLGRDGVKFIIMQSAVEIIFADNLTRVKNLIEWKDETISLKTVVSFVETTEELVRLAKEKELRLLTLDQLREIGRNHPVEPVPPKPTDTAMIMYTSGSTGEPKGCIITHDGFMSSIYGTLASLNLLNIPENELHRVLMYLPLAHVFGCATIAGVSYFGGEVGFWQGKVEKLLDDFRDFRPTAITIVPRLLNKLYDKVLLESRNKGIIGQTLLKLAIQGKLALIRRGNFSQNTIWDKLIFRKIRQSFGGKVNRIISTSAPLSREVCQFSRAAFSCVFIECYGQTECIMGCAQSINDIEPGATGTPTPLNYLKLVDVPEKSYYAKDGIGEICVKSPAVFKGYLKDEAKTREAIDEQGWLHTGDIGRWTPHKTMQIVDRKKNMYKLSQGEYVAPEKIEDVYARSRFVSQIFIYGNSLENFLVGIVVLENEYIKQWASNQGFDLQENLPSGMKKRLKQVVLDDMICEGKQRGLMSFEQVKAIEFIQEPFSIENGLLTPTFKARRYAVEKRYKDMFEKIYKTAKA